MLAAFLLCSPGDLNSPKPKFAVVTEDWRQPQVLAAGKQRVDEKSAFVYQRGSRNGVVAVQKTKSAFSPWGVGTAVPFPILPEAPGGIWDAAELCFSCSHQGAS